MKEKAYFKITKGTALGCNDPELIWNRLQIWKMMTFGDVEWRQRRNDVESCAGKPAMGVYT